MKKIKLTLFVLSIIISGFGIYAYGTANTTDKIIIYGRGLFFYNGEKYTSVPVNISTSTTTYNLWSPEIDNMSYCILSPYFYLELTTNTTISISVKYNGIIYSETYNFESIGKYDGLFFLSIDHGKLEINVELYSNTGYISSMVEKVSNNMLTYNLPIYGITISFENVTDYTIYNISATLARPIKQNRSSYIYLPYFVTSDNFTNIGYKYFPYATMYVLCNNQTYFYNFTVSNGIETKSVLVYEGISIGMEITIIQQNTTFHLKTYTFHVDRAQ